MYRQQVKPIYLDAIKLTLMQQIPAFVICHLLLDSGKTLRVCLIALLGFWLFAMLCLARSSRESDPIGLLFLRWGFFPLFGILLFLNGILHPAIHHESSAIRRVQRLGALVQRPLNHGTSQVG